MSGKLGAPNMHRRASDEAPPTAAVTETDTASVETTAAAAAAASAAAAAAAALSGGDGGGDVIAPYVMDSGGSYIANRVSHTLASSTSSKHITGAATESLVLVLPNGFSSFAGAGVMSRARSTRRALLAGNDAAVTNRMSAGLGLCNHDACHVVHHRRPLLIS
jgi:hypothetical protein